MSKPTKPAAVALADSPADYAKLADYYDAEMQLLFPTYKGFQHHLDTVQAELEESGALIRVGKLLCAHKARFWPEFKAAHAAAALARRASTTT
jgi:hypothetical protein